MRIAERGYNVPMRPPQRLGSPFINQRNFVLVIAAIILLIIIAFFGFEFRSLGAPMLEILTPERDVRATSDVFDVKGRADRDADITLNGRPLFSGGTGEFTERVFLVPGVNRLEFSAKNRYGKTTVVIRYIVVPFATTASSTDASSISNS